MTCRTPTQDSAEPATSSLPRRRALVLAAGSLALSAGPGWALVRFLRGASVFEPNRSALVNIGAPENYPTAAVSPKFAKDHQLLVVRTATEIFALRATCTHLGCALSGQLRDETFVCACHGSRFSVSGERLSGPARRSLDRFKIERRPDGLHVDTAVVLHGPECEGWAVALPAGRPTHGQAIGCAPGT